MKPAPFAFRSARDVDDAQTALAMGASGEAMVKPVAGNQSLGPMLNLRLARPEMLVDVSALADLRDVHETRAAVRLGAAITHAEIEDGEVPDPTGGWLAAAAGNIAHRAVRNRGTLGGSLAHADPAADWVIVMTGLGASVILASAHGERVVPMADFIIGPFATALAPDELVKAVEVPRPGPGARWGYWKFCRQVGEFAKASATVLDDPANHRRLCVLGALGDRPRVLDDADDVIERTLTPRDAVARALADHAERERTLHVTALSRALALALASPSTETRP